MDDLGLVSELSYRTHSFQMAYCFTIYHVLYNFWVAGLPILFFISMLEERDQEES